MAGRQISIVIVNYNGSADLLACLDSLFRGHPSHIRVLICDNASTDDSHDRVVDWQTRHKVTFAERTDRDTRPLGDARLIWIQTGANLGFAGGNNVGLRLALDDDFSNVVWILNADTLIAPDTLSVLDAWLDSASEKPFMMGTELYFADDPQTLQAYGGAWFDRTTMNSGGIGLGSRGEAVQALRDKPPRPDYIVGASILVNRAFLARVGLMNEDYFLYFEEIDWALRARATVGGDLTMGTIPGARLYHKHGGSIGSSSRKGGRSLISERYLVESRFLFTRRFFPWKLPVVCAVTLAQILKRLLRRQPRHAGAILKGCGAGAWKRLQSDFS